MKKTIDNMFIDVVNEKLNIKDVAKDRLYVGKIGVGAGKMTRLFQYQNFNPEYAQGFAKLIFVNNKLYIKVIDTYGQHTEDEEIDYVNEGYILIGYQSRKVSASISKKQKEEGGL